ncbi:MarR family winged helix-turn-helix transcriptional regulator [Quadrisphaera sp. INWT6]|uniref:MarR family winged helix-turn-helix transcriptional regulator n=1 Tax=Quadrisphaera sp. INWT6 TaxID=2596917 RepID=UPI0018924CBF|nr:MarR family transcriptional regulator [Quadrisphaera sp. INWT6]MBF5082369.1 MarR family transcriptional regulator [Quadrisphaera sp. INWT6]
MSAATGSGTGDGTGGAGRHGHAVQVLGALRALATSQRELGRHFARARGMHTTDANAIVEVLTAEQRGAPLTPARLAERVGLSTGATSTLLNRLEEAGHLVRSREHRDRRVVTLHSTHAIHDTADGFYAPLTQQLHTVLLEYSPAELRLVQELASRLSKTVDDYIASVPTTQTQQPIGE